MDQYKALLEENQKLKEENKRLKLKLKELGYYFDNENIALNKEQRLQIFMDYFKGRPDLYAYKYFHKQKKKFQFSAFDCQNKFSSHGCLIKQGKRCSADCPFFHPKVLTKEVILKHIQEPNNAIGIYPLFEDNTCFFLAIDFDDDLWFDNLLSVYRVARKYSISCIMERSQSGQGGHLWIFFSTAIKAAKARDLGDFLINEAMKTNKHLSFKSFDRMFPNQDTLSGKGFGNFIALPLQYDAIKNKNSMFINEFQQPILRPFHHLLGTNKVNENQIDNLLKIQPIKFENSFDFNTPSLFSKITQPIAITEDSLIHISSKDLSTPSLQTIRKLATINNPEYQERLRLHLSVFQIPRTLTECIEDDAELHIPRGLKESLLNYIDSDSLCYENHTQIGEDIEVSFIGSLRTNQQAGAKAMLRHEIAMMEAVPGFGKTVIALYLITAIKKSTLIIVPSKELLLQWKLKIDEFIDYPQTKLKRDHYIGEYHSSKKRLRYHIDIALIQSLAKMKDASVLQNYGLVIIDECHHASSDTYRTVLRNISAKYIYSFSGTPKRKDRMDKIISMYLGNIVYQTDKKEIIQSRKYDQLLIPRVTTFKCIDHEKKFTEICNELYKNKKRNYLIIKDIIKEMADSKNMIIITDRKEHIQILYNELKYNDYNIYCMDGTTLISQRQIIREQLSSSEKYLIIATSQLLGEGFDLPSLNTMFITMPISYEGRLSQYVGRLHRDYETKEIIKVYDYVDANVRMLQNMFQKRLRTYKKEGYKSIENNEVTEIDQVIFNKENYEYFLHIRMQEAKKNIVLFISDCKLNRIQRLNQFLISLIAKGTKIYICIHKDYNEVIMSYLEGMSTKILYSDITINGIMIDENELWTGSCSYLGVQSNDLCYIKTNDTAIIEELKAKIN